MHFFPRHIITITLLLVTCFTTAQPVTHKAFRVNEEGNSPRIFSLIRYSTGCLVAGTSSGLYKFQGQEFSLIPFADTVAAAITAMAEDRAGKLWLGFQNGMIGWSDLKHVYLLRPEEGYPNVSITSIVADSTGTVYFATAGEGVYYYRKKRFYNINTDDGLSDNYVYQLLLQQGGLLAGTDRGINTIHTLNNKKRLTTFSSINGLPDNIARCLYSNRYSRNSNCWVGMQDHGIGLFSPAQNLFFSQALLSPWLYGQVNSMVAQQQQLWVATEDRGIVAVHFHDTAFTRPSAVMAVGGFPKASNLLTDHEGNIWFTSNNELIRTPGAQLQTIVPLSEQEFTEAHAILCDKNQNVWINNNAGLRRYSFDPVTGNWMIKNFPLSSINATTDITSIYEDIFGNIWIGTMGKGVFIIDPKNGRSRNLTEDNLLIDGSVLSITGKDNRVWISSLGGAVLCKLKEENKDITELYDFENYNRVSGIGSNYIYSILIDSKDRIWFATDGRGVTMLDKGKYANFIKQAEINRLVVYNLCEDRIGNIWFGTNSGLYVFDGNKFKKISVEQGLLEPVVTALALDAKGNIVAISKKGINLVDANTHAVSYLDANQGLAELNSDLNCISTSNGDVYFMARQGIMKFTASYQSLQPPVLLEQVKVFDRDVKTSEENVFAYDDNNFTFHYSGVSFSHPEKIRYRLKLEGFSTDWISTKENAINFPRLPAGTYTFRVRTSLNQYFDESKEASFTFTIRRPFWFRWWFIALALVLVGGILYWYIKARERRVKRWERLEKEKIRSQFETLKSQVNPHFLFNSFNTLISVIEENPSSAVTYVEHMSDLYRKIVTYRDKDTISLYEEVQLIKDYFFIQQKRFGDHLQLVINISNDEQHTYSIAPLTLQLLCENAVKHNAISAATPLVIELFIDNETLVVKNNINPKYTTEKSAGMGLQNIRKRYELLSQQQVRIEKTEETFIVYIPLLLL